VFYIHHDGYPEGATNKFQSFLENMFVKQTTYKGKTEWVRRRKLHHAFIAGLPKAEESSHDEHGDTEWQYRISWVDQENIWPTYPEKVKESKFNPNVRVFANEQGERFKLRRLWINVMKVNYNCKHCDGDIDRHWSTYFRGPLAVFIDMHRKQEPTEYYPEGVQWADEIVSVWKKTKASKGRYGLSIDEFEEILIPRPLLREMLAAPASDGEPIQGHGNQHLRENLVRGLSYNWMPWHSVESEQITEHELHMQSGGQLKWEVLVGHVVVGAAEKSRPPTTDAMSTTVIGAVQKYWKEKKSLS